MVSGLSVYTDYASKNYASTIFKSLVSSADLEDVVFFSS